MLVLVGRLGSSRIEHVSCCDGDEKLKVYAPSGSPSVSSESLETRLSCPFFADLLDRSSFCGRNSAHSYSPPAAHWADQLGQIIQLVLIVEPNNSTVDVFHKCLIMLSISHINSLLSSCMQLGTLVYDEY